MASQKQDRNVCPLGTDRPFNVYLALCRQVQQHNLKHVLRHTTPPSRKTRCAGRCLHLGQKARPNKFERFFTTTEFRDNHGYAGEDKQSATM